MEIYDALYMMMGLLLFFQSIDHSGAAFKARARRRSPRRKAVTYMDAPAVEDNTRCKFSQPWDNMLGGCYLLTKKAFTWNEASKVCKDLDEQADFGALWTAKDTAFLAKLAAKQKISSFFVNGKYSQDVGEFRWQFNRPFVKEDTPWDTGEPKMPDTNRVLVFNADGRGRGALATDAPTGSTRPILCKRPAIGFRRRTATEMGDHSAELSKVPVGWRSAQGRAGSLQPEEDVNRGQVTQGAAIVTRSLPPPISQDRIFKENPSHFVPVMPSDIGDRYSKHTEVSAIVPVDVVDMVKAREDKLNELFGRSTLRLKEYMNFYPEDYRYPATEYQRMAHVLTTELIAQDQRERKTNAPYETAKLLTMELFKRGKSIQCYFGDEPETLDNRQVECIATAGVVESCIKQTLLTGKIIRGCSLPGNNHHSYYRSGCQKTTSGEICYCVRDLCNRANTFSVQVSSLLFVMFYSLLLIFYNFYTAAFRFCPFGLA
ncbi:uncharacterized protein LOC129594180 isoform X2 [Paramacrobiotus metropolitanus]|uniref:uncharacterized protein LOC129594180 isoform X2 n=1 Tax=Paramacrobiotus metropolitanus TaxID=2943436 RepID=UPI002445D138|nr:uncharacterized protein LOC129594180 isoform X2 [Paramacrobiotus metropolitanus]